MKDKIILIRDKEFKIRMIPTWKIKINLKMQILMTVKNKISLKLMKISLKIFINKIIKLIIQSMLLSIIKIMIMNFIRISRTKIMIILMMINRN